MPSNSFKPPTREFWADFVPKHWRKSPTLISTYRGQPIFSGDELFQILKTSSRKFEQTERGEVVLKFFTEHGQVVSDHERWLPREEETSLNYVKRVTEMIGGGKFGVTLEESQQYMSWPVFNKLKRFLEGLTQEVGLPPDRYMADIFFGTYKTTPFGVHKDKAEVFAIVADGKKRMRLWERDLIEKHPEVFGSIEYKKHLANSIVLEGGPGEILFWPSRLFHTAESVDESAHTSSLHVGFFKTPLYEKRAIFRALEDKVKNALGPETHQPSAPITFESSYEEFAKLRELMISEKLDEEEILHLAMNHSSGFGFRYLPAARPLDEANLDGCRLSLAQPVSILTRELKDGRVIVSCNGRSLPFAGSLWITEFIEWAKAKTKGEFTPAEAAAVLRSKGHNVSEKAVVNFSRILYSYGGLEIFG